MTKTEQAVLYAVYAHMGAVRKGTRRPYILHPLEVLTIVSSLTEDEDTLAAAVLHDTGEDTRVTLEDIRRDFGPETARLVGAESENNREDRPAEDTWLTRKQETVEHLERTGAEGTPRSRSILYICLGDKLANLREIARNERELGPVFWERFNQKDKRMHAWYYTSVYRALKKALGDLPPLEEFAALLEAVFGDTPLPGEE